jgi:hypothetical protein
MQLLVREWTESEFQGGKVIHYLILQTTRFA